MKKSVLIIFTSVLLIGCSSESLNDKQDRMAKTFFENKISESSKLDTKQVTEVVINSRDSVNVINSQMVSLLKLQPLVQERNTNQRFATKLKDIDESFGREYDKTTLNAIKKVNSIQDKIDKELVKVKQLSDKDTVGYIVHYNVDMKLTDATSIQGRRVPIAFYKDGELYNEFLDIAYKQSISFTK